MKKAIAIIILGLLVCNTSFSEVLTMSQCVSGDTPVATKIIIDKEKQVFKLENDQLFNESTHSISEIKNEVIFSEVMPYVKLIAGKGNVENELNKAGIAQFEFRPKTKQYKFKLYIYGEQIGKSSKKLFKKIWGNDASLNSWIDLEFNCKKLLTSGVQVAKKQGCIEGNCSNGQGTHIYANGNKYVGEWKDGKKHGQGTYTYASGNKYVGEWKDNERHGQGTFTWPSGGKYVGEFIDSEQHGQGTYTGSDGIKYVGEFKDGNKHGQGTYTYASGNKYVGEWKNGLKHGQGTFTFADGTKYVGEFKDGKYHGQGTFTWADGTKYVGEHKDDKRHGQGTYTWADGSFQEGIWKNDRFVTKKKVEPKPKYDDEKIIIIASGSGFFVSDQGHIVSNAHVIGVCKKVKAYEAGKEIYLDILATDNVNDIGLVKGKFKNIKYLNIKTDGAELGEDIVAFGYPLSQTLSDSVKLTKGIVSSLSGPDNNYSQIQIDAAIQPGNSGGPVLNMNGQVVGIASAGLSKLYMAENAGYIPENVNFAVAAQSLTTFLKANKVKVISGPTKIYSTKELAKIGEPVTIQLFCMNTKAEYAKLKEADKHSDVLLDLQ